MVASFLVNPMAGLIGKLRGCVVAAAASDQPDLSGRWFPSRLVAVLYAALWFFWR